MLKISKSIKSSAQPREGGIGIGDDSRVGRNSRYKFDRSEIDSVEVNGGKFKDNEVGKKVQKIFKSKKLSKSNKTVGSDFFTPGARLAFIKLR